MLIDPKGAGLLYGPRFAGKSDLMEQIAVKVSERAAVAVVDGAKLKPTAFLANTLTQFGYDLGLCSADELLSMLNVFAVQQARTHEAPVLIVENFDQMYPSTLGVLCKLATLRMNKRFALRIVLVGEDSYRPMIEAPSLRPLAERLCGEFQFQPLTARESLVYLYARLQSLEIENPDAVFKSDVCQTLHENSQGWPGKLDEIATAVACLKDRFPIDLQAALSELDERRAEKAREPELLVSKNGELLARVKLVRDRYLLGRSEISDIVIDDRYVSKHHALLVMADVGMVLVDMKSRNGTFVNSQKIQSRVLRNNDIIAIGGCRIKVHAPPGYVAGAEPDLADTSKMKNIGDARDESRQVGDGDHLRRNG